MNFKRINRRMHNKSWIADNRVAIVGGRNIGDEYFGAGEEMNFVDLDFAMLGPIVRDASAAFDKYWNSASAYPMETLDPDGVSEEALEKLRKLGQTVHERNRRTAATRPRFAATRSVKRMIAGDWPMQWSSKYRFVVGRSGQGDDDEARCQAHAGRLGPRADGPGGANRRSTSSRRTSCPATR